MKRLVFAAYALALLVGCSSRWERGGKCWDTPDKGGNAVQCPPPDVWKEFQDGPDAGARPTADDDVDLDLEAENVNDSRGY